MTTDRLARALVALVCACMLAASCASEASLEERTSAALEQVEPSLQPVLGDPIETSALAFADADAILEVGEVLATVAEPGDGYGRLMIRHADGSRTLLDRRCQRVDVVGRTGLCLTDVGALEDSYLAEVFDASTADLPTLASQPNPLPSRARISPDAGWASTTSFLDGEGYSDIAEVTTHVQMINLLDGPRFRRLETWDIVSDDDWYVDPGRTFWGATFAPDNRFWITIGVDDRTELLLGDPATSTLSPTGIEGSCPTVSPDGSTLIVKRARPDGSLGLIALNLESGAETELGESRNVEDQVAWLDDDTILYALHVGDPEVEQPKFDVWSLDVTPDAEPVLFMEGAASPAPWRPVPD